MKKFTNSRFNLPIGLGGLIPNFQKGIGIKHRGDGAMRQAKRIQDHQAIWSDTPENVTESRQVLRHRHRLMSKFKGENSKMLDQYLRNRGLRGIL